MIFVGPEMILTEISEFLLPVVVGLQQLQVVRLVSITHFLEFTGVGGLCVRAKSILHAISPKNSRLRDL